MEKLGFYINNQIVYVDLKRTDNKNMYLKVTKENTLLVTAPKRVAKHKIEAFVAQHIDKFSEYINKAKAKVLFSFREEFIYIFGKKYILKTLTGFKKQEAVLKGKTLYIHSKEGDEEKMKILLLDYLKSLFNDYIIKKEKEYEKLMDIPAHTVRVVNKATTWGTNNIKTQSISYALRLVHYSEKVIDYVIVHELSHYIKPDHSEAFWNIVETYLPEYKEYMKQLRHDEALKEEE